jgi:hypothetical protein
MKGRQAAQEACLSQEEQSVSGKQTNDTGDFAMITVLLAMHLQLHF